MTLIIKVDKDLYRLYKGNVYYPNFLNLKLKTSLNKILNFFTFVVWVNPFADLCITKKKEKKF